MRTIRWQEWHEPIEQIESEEEQKFYPVIKTDYGLVSMKLNGPIKSDLKFVVGHTNFDLTEVERKKLNIIRGIEILTIFSRYRFRIGIGYNFLVEKVKRNVEVALCGRKKKFHLDKPTILEIKKYKIDLQGTGKPWIMYVLPNGSYEGYVGGKRKEYEFALSKYNEAQKYLGGKILTNES